MASDTEKGENINKIENKNQPLKDQAPFGTWKGPINPPSNVLIEGDLSSTDLEAFMWGFFKLIVNI